MPRDVQDQDGIRWSCVQAFAGLSDDPEKREAARVEEGVDRYYVVCTPSGGAASVRLELPGDWEEQLSDEQLLQHIQRQREAEGQA